MGAGIETVGASGGFDLGGPNSKYNATAQTILPNIIKHNKILWSPISNFCTINILGYLIQHFNTGIEEKTKTHCFICKYFK